MTRGLAAATVAKSATLLRVTWPRRIWNGRHPGHPCTDPGWTQKDRWWEVRDPRGELVCVTVYKRGAVEVVRRLAA